MSETGISPLLLLIVINCDGRGWGVPREGAHDGDAAWPWLGKLFSQRTQGGLNTTTKCGDF